MAKARTANFGVYAIRKAMGVKAKRASAFNACIGAKMKGKRYSRPPGEGGRNNVEIRKDLIAANAACGGSRKSA